MWCNKIVIFHSYGAHMELKWFCTLVINHWSIRWTLLFFISVELQQTFLVASKWLLQFVGMQLDVLDENYLVSSSIDRTLSLWDLRRYHPLQLPYLVHGQGFRVRSFKCPFDILRSIQEVVCTSTNSHYVSLNYFYHKGLMSHAQCAGVYQLSSNHSGAT